MGDFVESTIAERTPDLLNHHAIEWVTVETSEAEGISGMCSTAIKRTKMQKKSGTTDGVGGRGPTSGRLCRLSPAVTFSGRAEKRTTGSGDGDQ